MIMINADAVITDLQLRYGVSTKDEGVLTSWRQYKRGDN
jgi:hypothetical protein